MLSVWWKTSASVSVLFRTVLPHPVPAAAHAPTTCSPFCAAKVLPQHPCSQPRATSRWASHPRARDEGASRSRSRHGGWRGRAARGLGWRRVCGAGGVAAEQLVAEAEESLAIHLSRKSVANGSLGCGEPNLSTQPNTCLLSSCGKPNFRCGKWWRATKQPCSVPNSYWDSHQEMDHWMLYLYSSCREQGTESQSQKETSGSLLSLLLYNLSRISSDFDFVSYTFQFRMECFFRSHIIWYWYDMTKFGEGGKDPRG